MDKIWSLISKLCQPTSKSVPDDIERILIFRRNKTLVCILITLLLAFAPFLNIFMGLPLAISLRMQGFHVVNLILFLSLCRSYLWAYHLFFVIWSACFPFIFLKVAEEFAFMQIGHSFILPILVLLLTNKIFYGVLIVIVQTMVALFKTKHILLDDLRMMDPEAFITRMVHSGLAVSIGAFIIFSINLYNLNKRTREVMLANKVNEDIIEKQRTFLFSFSHEMRNPLNSLLGNLELTLMESLPSRVGEMIKTAQICSEILLQQINNVLDTGKHDIGSLEVNLAQVEVHSMFQKIWSLSGELIRRKNLKGIFKIDKKIPKTLLLDAHRINQVMINLIGNAIKFTENGSLTLSVNWCEDKVLNDEIFEPIPYDDESEGLFEKNQCVCFLDIPSKHNHDRNFSYETKDYYLLSNKSKFIVEPSINHAELKGILKIMVSDTGSGMSEENLGQLFQKFSQVSNDPNKRKMGTGLGLFITKEICTKMEADIRVYSKLGRGTTFILCIPTISASLNSQCQIQRSLTSMFELVARRNLQCLVADDSPLNVAMVCNFLEKIGVRSTNTAGNGEEAFNLYKQNRQAGKMVDIVTLDIDMPKMNGITACEKIREYERANRLTPALILLISGNYAEEQIMKDLANDREKKADCFLKKPLKFEEFYSTVFRLIENRV